MCNSDAVPFHPLCVSTLEAPAQLNNPFDYEPHPLTLLAADCVRKKLADTPQWAEEVAAGKMFGVLVCADEQEHIGFLAAYSGQIGGRADWPWFVPAVFDYLQPDGYFKQEEQSISSINRRISEMRHSDEYVSLSDELYKLQQQRDEEIEAYKSVMHESKRRRDSLRGNVAEEALVRESQFQKAELRRLKRRWTEATEKLETQVGTLKKEIDGLEEERQRRSEALQLWLFDHFVMLNAKGEKRSLLEIFHSLPPQKSSARFPVKSNIPPSGTGECCAPKLLQYAFAHGLKPLCIGEFWQGRSPRQEVRHHDSFYPACRGKCKPVLEWMLCNPHLADPDTVTTDLTPRVVYSDDSLIVIDKPSGLLSVPGRSDMPSVQGILRLTHPDVFMVHRLDQDTSGLMVAALTQESYHHLQRQFLERTIYKRYEALLDGDISHPSHVDASADGARPVAGTISLPLRPDPLDRPRQVVDHDHGKVAVTDYRVIATGDGRTRVLLTPHTGRTHQLRVHCAHTEGLDAPIVGDKLYGRPADSRLCLHAATLAFTHPVSGRRLQFDSPAPF